MMLRTSSIAFLLASLAACSSSTDDSSAGASSDLSTTTQFLACSTAVPTADGRFLVYAACDGQLPGVYVTPTAGGGARPLWRHGDADVVETLNVEGSYAYWLTRHADGTKSFGITAVKGANGVTTLALGADVDTINHVIVTDAGSFAFADRHTVDGTKVSELVVGKLGSHDIALRTTIASQWGFNLRQNALDSRLLLTAGTIGGGATDGKPRLAYLTLGPTPALSPFVEVATDDHVSRIFQDSYSAGRLLATMRRPDFSVYFAQITAATGKVDLITDGFVGEVNAVAGNGSVWYTARRPEGVVLERIRNADILPAPRPLLTSPDAIDIRLSSDESAVVYRTGGQGGPHEVGVMPSDGVLAPTIILPRSANKRVTPLTDDARLAPRVLLHTNDLGTGQQQAVFVDDVSGAILGSWDAVQDFGIGDGFTIAGNGDALFLTHTCNTSGDDPRGFFVEKVWPSVAPLTSCTTGAARQPSAVPGTDVLMSQGQPGPGASRLVTIVRP